ncbi:MAG: sulfite exporter TauE/SafE family protein [candidate division KSB1 bacterium]|nr:sulfite exporter TauE/SafE family protein [candidate division KSB1 bacterium]MDZ7273838.1 sulfite exporter TauE/SafE family protein [candidate division KSB1 bacterium]MDZ7285994.1 sulfite exporter TauE/SafE family protein [candidate division KSB1 bacterium]MDZ7299026.1 sulfite exporter TauE/SafE family protein [candidate division KSB1 bacterium]MDZ7308003.1 sulfite exporter TauE/SafE family protein [candidate division KSB1 bacterium]
MTPLTTITLTAVIFATAALYASVGQAGGSGYLAAMALFGLPPEIMKPTALVLNILVSALALTQFHRAGFFSWTKFWPFALTSVPFAFAGGSWMLPATVYRCVVGGLLAYAALRLFCLTPGPAVIDRRTIPRHTALLAGGAIGLLSGLTGVGGGIFLSPLLLLRGWADTRESAALSAAFILVNSIAGLFGHLAQTATLPRAIVWWALAAAGGGYLGAAFGSRRFAPHTLRRLLVLILLLAAVKMIVL